jgi:hypothetical protein
MIKTSIRNFLPIAPALAAIFSLANSASATLIPINVVPSTGNGLGAVNSVVTFQNTGTEVGAIGLTSGGALTTGSTVAYGIPGFPSASGVTNEQTGAGNNVYTATSLGLASSGSNTFANVILLFNGSEGGNAADQSISLTNLSLNLYNSSTGALLGTFSTASAYNVTAFEGTGNAGYGFQLDATQAGQANALLATQPNLTIGAAARATGSNAGLETISISRIGSIQPPSPTVGVPDSGATVALLGLGLMCIEGMRRRLRR